MKKKYILFIGLIILLLFIIINPLKNFKNNFIEEESIITSEELKEKLIRFHVIANSDSDKDQDLKLKVRDEIIKYISPKLKNSKSLAESRNLLLSEDEKIKDIAKKCIKDNGYDYKVESSLGMANFPVKNYGNITLPQGEYEAYRVIIGSGQGQNWWCVMFPPLCFVDVTNGQVAIDETEKTMKKVLSENEYSKINNLKEKDDGKLKKIDNKENKKGKIKIKFKIGEVLSGLIENNK
ncbi:stage II sporulation protein R [Clostridium fallax]|uniref:Stage II sporulation protein R n=1 Tax=Clostridium fallax TaxID=1533 RepID=A0A1M4WI48_9CLOT|nr:stage II sporulation protein R [Clostridium fallax]SHE80919.1 stage II sporulation protein R [Clostridium fallax]SQB05721.1 stage II sporulation protein R [Clostridium fallax]